MSRPSRERWLLALLPALATAIIYTYGWGRPASRAVNEAQRRVELTRQSSGADTAARVAQATLDDLQQRVERERMLSVALEERTRSLASGRGVTDSHTQALSALTQTLAAHGLILIRSSPVTDNAGVPNGRIESLCRTLGWPQPRYCRVEFSGSFGDVVNAIRALEASSHLLAPVSIETQPLPDLETPQSERLWTLTVWM